MATRAVVRLAAKQKLLGYIAVSPPIGSFANLCLRTRDHILRLEGATIEEGDSKSTNYSPNGLSTVNMLILHGRRDNFASVAAVERIFDAIRRRGKCEIAINIHPHGDHFWHGYELYLQEKVKCWVQPLLQILK